MEREFGYLLIFASPSIGDANLSCRCAQNGGPCLATIFLANVVSICSRVLCYHDGLFVVDVIMYSVVCGESGMLVLVDLLIVRLNVEPKL